MSEKRLYSILAIVLWVLGSFGIWEVVYELSHMVGAIVSGDPGYALGEFLRMLPMVLVVATFLFDGVFLHNAFVADNDKVRRDNWKKMGVFMFVMSALIVVYVLVGMITGRYFSIVEGNPTWLFPLDTVIFAVLFTGFGYWALKRKPLENLKYGTRHYKGVVRGIGLFFCILSYFISTSAFAGFMYGIFIMDWSHGYLLFNFAMLLVFAVAFGNFAVYRFVYRKLPEGGKPSGLVKMSLISLGVALISIALYLAAVEAYPMAPNQNAFGLYPVDFTASVSVFPFILGANNILVPVCALIYGLIAKKKVK